MFRLSRPVLQQVLKKTTGITGIPVHPNPLPALRQAYEATLKLAATIPAGAVYRQSVEALTQHKLRILEEAKGSVAAAEAQLDEGQIEEALEVAQDELKTVANMIEWKAWEPLVEKPAPGQWEYFGKLSGSL
ncbi:NADH2 dehydrogenase [Athelia psychrophila]|uniref:NADH2 dehydrogenase n=1 Tax=Athelia psychrophila TaxID=1759441 RepID=A0A166U4J1_9AGAM|nr:NADH2 dehydrogenase [Fibularhizoctonia sp. CBS 109695]